MRIPHLIGGRTVDSPTTFETINPTTQDVLAEVARGGEAEVHAAVQAAQDAFPACLSVTRITPPTVVDLPLQ